MRRRILFEAEAFEDFNQWAKTDRKIYNKVVELIKDIERSPDAGELLPISLLWFGDQTVEDRWEEILF